MAAFNQEDLSEQKGRESFVEITKRAAREAVRLYFQPLLHPRETLTDLLGKTPAEHEQESSNGPERR